MGLKGSGKTTYLAALWHLVEAGELPSTLVVPELQPDRQYLNRIRDSWLMFKPVGRTGLRSEEVVSLVLRDCLTGAAIDLSLPDFSGELFRLQWETRRASARYAKLAEHASGVLLFLHAAEVRKSERIPPEFGGDTDVTAALGANGKSYAGWSPLFAPTQVQLVEMLQFASFLHESRRLTRIAVVISAWDLVKGPVKPVDWLESQLPLLSQFLESNQRHTPYWVFGVSAQGGDFAKDKERLEAEAVPARRIRVVGEKLDSSGDLIAPLRLLLGLS